jgi:hypothetical protein
MPVIQRYVIKTEGFLTTSSKNLAKDFQIQMLVYACEYCKKFILLHFFVLKFIC